jgi:hypothetical protein
MVPGPEPSSGLEAFLAAGVQPAAVEAGRRWANASADRPPGILLVVGGDATDRAAYLGALAREARAAGRTVRLARVAELEDTKGSGAGTAALLVHRGDALPGHPAAIEMLVSRWDAIASAGLAMSLTSQVAIGLLPPAVRERLADAEIASLDQGQGQEGPAEADEFGDFLADVATVVAGLLDDEPGEASAGRAEDEWLGDPAPDRSLGDYVLLKGADSVGARIAREVLATPGAGYSPLTIWAETGTGKTTLLAGIARAYRERYPDRAVAFVAGAEGVRSGAEGIGRADLLVIDDLDGIPEPETVVEVVAAVCQAGGQVVVSCSRPPDVLALPERLTSLLRAGAVVGIGAAEGGESAEVGPASAVVTLLGACDCADWIALDERIIEEPV